MSARCRVCHRELRDAAAIAAGIGPICATKSQRVAARQVSGEDLAVAAYPAARLQRIQRMVAYLSGLLEDAECNRSLAHEWGTVDDQRHHDARYALALRWLRIWRAMEARARRAVVAA